MALDEDREENAQEEVWKERDWMLLTVHLEMGTWQLGISQETRHSTRHFNREFNIRNWLNRCHCTENTKKEPQLTQR